MYLVPSTYPPTRVLFLKNDFVIESKMDIMIDVKKSRHRGDNWTQDEKGIFLQIMQESAPIIENKLTDTDTNKQKSLEWLYVQKKLKELSGNERDVGQLKGLWRRMKRSAKKNVSQHKRLINETGGGYRPPSPSQDDLKIMDLCHTDLTIEDNEFDSDGIFQCNVGYKADASFVEEIITENNEVHIETSANQGKKICMAEKEIKPVKVKNYKQKEKSHKVESTNKAAILKTNEDLKKRTAELLEEEYKLKLNYQKQEMCHQEKRHKLEIEILLLEKEKKELEIKMLRKSLE